ncbi:MAG: ABC transporter permease [Planctomycetota bacterium]
MNRTILTLLWRELESLFFSPLAYIVLTVFLVLSGFSFVLALAASGGVVSDTISIFLADGALFWVCLLMVPALVTMRLVAEERRSGTLEVLLTAPVRDREVILSKFFGALVFQAFLWAPTLIYIRILRGYGALPDGGQVFTSYLGIACVTALLTAIGLLFSTRTSNQIVAAVGSLTVNMLVLAVPMLVQAERFGVVGRAFKTVSILDHFATSFSRGLLDSGVLAFYVAATAGVLALCVRSLEARRWR